MKIIMLQSVNGKVDGVRMGPYTEGVEYDLDDERAKLFIGSAMAAEYVPPVVVEEVTDAPVEAADFISVQNIEDDYPKKLSRYGKK